MALVHLSYPLKALSYIAASGKFLNILWSNKCIQILLPRFVTGRYGHKIPNSLPRSCPVNRTRNVALVFGESLISYSSSVMLLSWFTCCNCDSGLVWSLIMLQSLRVFILWRLWLVQLGCLCILSQHSSQRIFWEHWSHPYTLLAHSEFHSLIQPPSNVLTNQCLIR